MGVGVNSPHSKEGRAAVSSPRNCSIVLTPKRQLGIDWGKEIGKGAPKGENPGLGCGKGMLADRQWKIFGLLRDL